MRKSFLFLAAAAMSLAAVAQTGSESEQASHSDVLMTINGKDVSAEEFLYIYEKNNQAGAMDPKSMDEYLDMFINFKLKVAEAEAQGIDTTESFQKELKGYRAQATPKYLQDAGAMDSLIEMSWRHMAKDRRAAHIAVQCPASATPGQVDSALATINEAYERVTIGKEVIKGKGKKAKKVRQPAEAFDAVARELSTDPNVQETGGELGWITPFRYVYPLEEAVYNTAIGAVSAPFRTQYGWHILYKEDERSIQPLDSMRAQIQRQVMRDERAKEADKSFIRKTRAEYNLPAEMSDADVKNYADEHLEAKYPELKNLVKEYHDGILLFEVSLREVWDKAAKDTAGLEAYFMANKKKYTWDKPHFKGWLLQCKDKQSAKAAQAIIKSADPDSVRSYIAHRVNMDSLHYVKVQHGLWEQGKNAAVDVYGLKVKGAEFTPSEDMPVVVCVGTPGKLKAPAHWDDEKGKVTTDYQDFLEAEWVKKLREKYPVVINEEVWNKIKK